MTLFIDGAIEILPLTKNLDVGFIYAPALANRTLVSTKNLCNVGNSLIAQRWTVE